MRGKGKGIYSYTVICSVCKNIETAIGDSYDEARHKLICWGWNLSDSGAYICPRHKDGAS